ncbi:MRP-S28 domain-containing protein [Aphelenchoides besseyi]|nr:MRP-S28 domain-containing protein [Aphelenchoides besseyi]KAI6229646.1 MRP-S28 domain-containing protein [Aphelenchoides besseyi]
MSGRRATGLATNAIVKRLKSDAVTANGRSNNPESNVTTSKEETFRPLFIQPQRKLAAQLAIERLTGRATPFERRKLDVLDRMAVRRPRQEEMPEDQDWPSVWPAAQTYRSSVVPLPLRMGWRRKPDKRPPFKREGNLELLKIPNFLHLTPEHIRRHCEAIKKFCTPFPQELKDNPKLVNEYFPVSYSYSDYVHQGTSIRDIRSRVVSMNIRVPHLGLDPHGEDKLKKLVGNRYDEKSDSLNIVSDRCYTRKQNREYSEYLLVVLYHESNKVEDWEKEARIYEPKTAETVDLAREYAEKVRKQLGIPRVTEDVPNQVEIA